MEDVFTKSHPEVNSGGVSQTCMLSLGCIMGGSELLLLSWEQSEVVSSVSRSGERVVLWNVCCCLGGILRQ